MSTCTEPSRRAHHGHAPFRPSEAAPSLPSELPAGLEIRDGTSRDLAALSMFHYRSSHPAGIDRVLAMVDRALPSGSPPVGVLVAAYPALWSTWRWQVWPAHFSRGNLSADAKALNARLRMISRVIVDPRYRGCGAAVALVRTYLDRPATPLTASIAAMGHCCPFFAAAGMHAHHLAPSPRNVELSSVFEHLGIDPWRLVHIPYARSVVRQRRAADALRRWHSAQRGSSRTRRRSLPLVEIAALAGASLSARPIVYTHEHASENGLSREAP